MKFCFNRFVSTLKSTTHLPILLFFIVLFCQNNVFAQYNLGNTKLDASALFAQTKQLTQFFRRFNGEEDAKGNKLDSNSSQFRNQHLRTEFLGVLFDKKNADITDDMKAQFIKDVTNEGNTKYLNFRGKDWFAEVNAVFTYQNRPVNILIYLEL